ncbi:hypothetical protein BpHYR1_028281, partial [Brachionus plicatilis]
APSELVSLTSDDYYPKNPALAYLYSVAPICLIYSIIKTRSLDADHKYSEQRKPYLYIHRLFKMKKQNQKQNQNQNQKQNQKQAVDQISRF